MNGDKRTGGINMKRVYLASPFFEEYEIDLVKQVEEILIDKGLDVFSPMRHPREDLVKGSRHWAIENFVNNLKFINASDLVVAIYHGQYSDSGTAWEIGYCYGTQTPVVTVHFGEISNLMVTEGSHANLTLEELKQYDFNKLISSFYTGRMI